MNNDSMQGVANVPALSLKGRVALITGASGGIGLHAAGLFARAGAAVALGARRLDKVEAAAAALREQGQRAIGVPLDVTDRRGVTAALDATEVAFGAPVDLLLNNAGVLLARPFVEQTDDDIARIFDTNLKGCFITGQEAACRMAAAGGGAIINVASTAALGPGAYLSSYCASKAGVVHLTRVMAVELARHAVRVNVICPGNIETDMHQTFVDMGATDGLLKRIPMHRFGQPEDLDGVLLLLASAAGRYMTGAVIPVDGGHLVRSL